MVKLLGECRCCRKPIDRSRLACAPHWAMLPKPLKDVIYQTYSNREWRAYATNVTEADKIWQGAGLWKPPIPMSCRADKGMEALSALTDGGRDAG